MLDTVDSTNAEAARRAASLDRPTWILARDQSAARGRRGRPWATGAGNFAATLVLRPGFGPEAAGLRSFVAALALLDGLGTATGRGDLLTLKWPNDVLLRGGKVAGILLESAGAGAALSWLAVGIGVNLGAIPPATGIEPGATRPVSVLGETGLRIAPEDFLDHLAPAFDRWERCLRTEGFAPLRRAFMAHSAARPGAAVTARLGGEVVQGTFDGLDENGALLLLTAQGPRAIAAGEVFFGQEAGHALGD